MLKTNYSLLFQTIYYIYIFSHDEKTLVVSFLHYMISIDGGDVTSTH
jgi:hypothetical protein